MKKNTAGKKTIGMGKVFFFAVAAGLLILSGFNFLCGFIAKDQYIALDPVDKTTAGTTPGYFYPNQNKLLLFPGIEPYRVRIDSNGFRNVGVDSGPFLGAGDFMKILCLGDSFTSGPLDDEDTYPYRLQTLISRSKRKAIVLNAAAGGASLPDYLYYLKEKGLALRPDVIVLNFACNDVVEIGSRDTPLYKKMIEDSAFSISRTLKKMKMMRMMRRFEMAHRYRRWMRKMNDPRRRRICEQDSKDLEDILYVAGEYHGPIVKNPHGKELAAQWSDFFLLLEEMIDLLRSKNVAFLYVLCPDIYTLFDRGQGYYQDILIDFLESKGVDYIDLRPVFKPRRKEFLELYRHLPRDFHLSGEGNQIFAEEVFKKLFGILPERAQGELPGRSR